MPVDGGTVAVGPAPARVLRVRCECKCALCNCHTPYNYAMRIQADQVAAGVHALFREHALHVTKLARGVRFGSANVTSNFSMFL